MEENIDQKFNSLWVLDPGVMVIVVFELVYRVHFGHGTRVQIMDDNDCISHSTYNLGKGMNLIILPPAMGK